MKLNQNEQNGPDWTRVGVYYLYLLKFMKITYGSLSMRGTESDLEYYISIQNYKYEYNDDI